MDVRTFLSQHAPFDGLDAARLAEVASAVEIEHFAPGTVVLAEAGEPAEHLYVIRKGAVEILDDGRLIDLMVEGETFGAWSLLAGFGPTATVRAHEDTLCYLIPRERALELLGTSEGIAFVLSGMRRRITRVGESLEGERTTEQYRPVGSLVRRPPVTCEPATTVAEAAERMARERVSCLLVDAGTGGYGILTDRDLRTRVVAERRPLDTRVSDVMTYPARSVSVEALAGEVLLGMLEGGFHHFPVERDGTVVGVVTDTDLMGVGQHTPFALKSAIERARDRDELVVAARDLPGVVSALVGSSVDPVDVGHVVGLAIDTMTQRLLELGIAELGDPPAAWAWLALGSAARWEQSIHTDQDHALAIEPHGEPLERVDPYFADLAAFVVSGLEAAGVRRCASDVMATNPVLRRSIEGWVEAFGSWMEDRSVAGSEQLSILFDYRRVAGPLDAEEPLDALLRTVPERPLFRRHLARRALDRRPPTGFFRDLVVEAKGDHAGRLDVKHGGTTLVTNLARAASIGAGLTQRRTIGRLRAARAAGALDEETSRSLEEAFRFLWGVRLEHHVACMAAGRELDDFVDPATLGPVTRQGLKEAFRVITRAQRALATELGVLLR